MSLACMWAALPSPLLYLKCRASGGETEARTCLKVGDWVVLFIELILYESK